MDTTKDASEKTTVLLVDDHMVVREGVANLILSQPDFVVAGTASDGLEAIQKVKALRPDIVIMDIGMPNLDGVQATHEIKRFNKTIRVIVFTMYADMAHAVSLYREGISGYVLKSDPVSDLAMALNAVREGGTYFSAVICDIVREHLEQLEQKGGGNASRVQDGTALLSVREKEVFPLLADGKTIKQIAENLCISPKTVETHKYNIMEKLRVNSIADLTKIALRKNLIEL